ncbi:MAG: TIGR02281 family clan AA aspartic protease [Gemmatimonadaceae bacterium]
MRRLVRSHLSPFAVALLAATACRMVGQGGPEYDAVSIVEGRASEGLRTDTIEAPFTVSIDKARWSLRTRNSSSHDFWADVEVLDVLNAEKSARSVDERTFAAALRTLMESDPDAAAVVFGALHARSNDFHVRTRSRVALTMALSWRSDWPALANLPEDIDSATAGVDPIVQQAGVERWARALKSVPSPVITLPDEPVVLPMRRSAFGTPIVTVRVNGREEEFWLDTGASMTLLSAAVAVDAKVTLAAPDTLALGVVAGHIPARAVFIDSLALGPVVAQGITAALVSPGALRLDRRVAHGILESVPIAGVIGTDLLRHLDVTLDAGEGTITIRPPRRDVRAPRNLFWVGYPVVRLVTKDGRPVLFGLDTGAEGTYVTTALLRKLPRTPVAARRMTMGGLGPDREQTHFVARDITLSDGDYAITLHNSPITPDRRWTFVAFDGVIGSDVALSSRMHLDFMNGVFDVRPVERLKDIKVTVNP